MAAPSPARCAVRICERLQGARGGRLHGAALADLAGLLEGEGKHMRHVKLRPGIPLNTDALIDLIAAAYADINRRLSAIGC